MRRLLLCIFVASNILCMQKQDSKPATVTQEEVIEYLKKSNIECIMCGDYLCEDLIERYGDFLKLKKKNLDDKKE